MIISKLYSFVVFGCCIIMIFCSVETIRTDSYLMILVKVTLTGLVRPYPVGLSHGFLSQITRKYTLNSYIISVPYVYKSIQ